MASGESWLPVRTEIIEKFFVMVRNAYGDRQRYPFHDFDTHIREVVTNAARIAERVDKHGTKVDLEVLVLAALGHDVLYGVLPSAFGCKSPEALSARYTGELLLKLGFNSSRRERVIEAIEATNFGVSPSGIEGKILRAADLFNVGGSVEVFAAGTEIFYQEHLANGGTLSKSDFKRGCVRHLMQSLKDLIALTPAAFDAAGRSVWHMNAIRNVFSMLSDVNENARLTILASGRCEEWMFECLRAEVETEQLVLAVSEGPNPIVETNPALGAGTYFGTIPGCSNLIPIHSGTVDVILCSAGEVSDWNELLRVIKPSGVMRLDANSALPPTQVMLALSSRGVLIEKYKTVTRAPCIH